MISIQPIETRSRGIDWIATFKWGKVMAARMKEEITLKDGRIKLGSWSQRGDWAECPPHPLRSTFGDQLEDKILTIAGVDQTDPRLIPMTAMGRAFMNGRRLRIGY